MPGGRSAERMLATPSGFVRIAGVETGGGKRPKNWRDACDWAGSEKKKKRKRYQYRSTQPPSLGDRAAHAATAPADWIQGGPGHRTPGDPEEVTAGRARRGETRPVEAMGSTSSSTAPAGSPMTQCAVRSRMATAEFRCRSCTQGG